MSIKKKHKLAVDLYKEAIEYTPFEFNDKLSGELNALIDFIESKDNKKEEDEVNSFICLIEAMESCLPYFKTQLTCINANNNKQYTLKEVEDKLINEYLNTTDDSIAEMNVNDWCVKNGIFNIKETNTNGDKN